MRPERDKRETGTLICWRPEAGFGFLGRAHGDDVFLSAKEASYNGIEAGELKVGMQLSFVIAQRDHQAPGRKQRAIKIKIVEALA
jgi:cold shock CspA family protein